LRIRVNFGTIIPGLLILLVGVALFVVWLILALVSFFLFFVPPLHGIFYVALGLLVASLVLMLAGGLIMATGVRGWWGAKSEAGAPEARSRRWYRDYLRPGERSGEIVGVVVTGIVGYYFYESQMLRTGFFSAAFGAWAQFFFYAPLAVGIVASLIRAGVGRRNPVRPLDILHGLLLFTAGFYLSSLFPFDFAHMGDLLPASVQFTVSWIPNWLARVALALVGIGGLASMVYNSVVYSSTKFGNHRQDQEML
jgi:hypothetical protein